MKQFLLNLLLALPLTAHSQASRLGEDLRYDATLTTMAYRGMHAPFWLVSNRYGLGTNQTRAGYLRTSIRRDSNSDSLRNWRIGYAADVVVARGMENDFTLQQLYADVQWKYLNLCVGQKERPMELKNQTLSSGAMTAGINARPVPQVRLSIPEFQPIPGTHHWLAIKGHLAYGWYTDNRWQRTFVDQSKHLYTANSKHHSKAGFVRLGNTDRFPLTATGGLEMEAQFGGEVWNLVGRPDYAYHIGGHYDLNGGLRDYLNAFFPGGKDINDGDYSNVLGNHVGSWHLRFDYAGKGWDAGFYMEHYFEDHSQLFWQYGWKDMTYGVEIRLPRNRFISQLTMEHISTMDQSGPIYNDATAGLPVQLSGTDQYYNHHVYGAWQHAGYTMGSPLLLSPRYNTNGEILVNNNRIRAYHIGLTGSPTDQLSWRFLYTHHKSLGAYRMPTRHPRYGKYWLAELTYAPRQIPGLNITAAYGRNSGSTLGNSHGGMLTVSYGGWINHTKKGK